ncbi:MAG: S23 ribosomal protein [Parcubacteria group bacterium Gr01-1014_18]|nr:MAG: S23 ribosomal protein [Parcubacteria group bacterium Greene0416_36]TSC80233.1 MAG: S23 ribosomal protein [Parcubacteria group bacterium Gr01-1014_18]TSC98415.1 MAG: S23 ribosomal protein [Parcubacteria group bacterium Greene1014_20]TSD06956.1 MAG: S23 ribosomal protein [Parcubacteria group bacterium Greene0714_2]
MFDFEQFPVYQKSEHYYAQALKILSNPKIDKNLKDQLKRASLSIVLNIAEGAGKYAKNDKKNFYVISKGSVNECVAILRILKIEGLIAEESFKVCYDLLLEIAKMLSGLINSMIQGDNRK